MKLPAVILGLCGGLVAQIPHGDAILSAFSSSAPLEGLAAVKRSPATITPITGLGATARGNNDVNSIQLDPVDRRVWIGGISASAGRLDNFTLNGNAVTSLVAVGTLSSMASVSAIAFDINGNAVCSSGQINTTGGLFRVHRKTNAVTRIAGGSNWSGQSGICNALCSDAGGNLYFGITGTPTTVYRLSPGNDGTYAGAPLTVGTIFPPSSSDIISSLAFAPAGAQRLPRLWWTTFGLRGTALGYLEGSNAIAQGIIGEETALNGLDYSPLSDDFWGVTAGVDPDNVMTLNHTGAHTVLSPLPPGGLNGSPSAIDANDIPFGKLTVLPQFLDGTIFDFEAGTTCPPGQIGGILITAPTTFVLTTATAGVDGRVFVKFPNVAVARGTPNSITFQAVCFNPTSGLITFGTPVTWPQN
jgi:hypothetical protein